MKKRNATLETALDIGNGMLRNSVVSPEERQAICVLLESLLHATNTYQGFRYLEADEVPLGYDPGIIWNRDGEGKLTPPHIYPDETRRAYY